jgi:hypothetical protein
LTKYFRRTWNFEKYLRGEFELGEDEYPASFPATCLLGTYQRLQVKGTIAPAT